MSNSTQYGNVNGLTKKLSVGQTACPKCGSTRNGICDVAMAKCCVDCGHTELLGKWDRFKKVK